mmetsp:Transcript_61698/g.145878  ORF Transcript_61698/g.145878 Transcript_61698/m.145878 type:complete len:234 (+) Transcript_61698:644-1345(+)
MWRLSFWSLVSFFLPPLRMAFLSLRIALRSLPRRSFLAIFLAFFLAAFFSFLTILRLARRRDLASLRRRRPVLPLPFLESLRRRRRRARRVRRLPRFFLPLRRFLPFNLRRIILRMRANLPFFLRACILRRSMRLMLRDFLPFLPFLAPRRMARLSERILRPSLRLRERVLRAMRRPPLPFLPPFLTGPTTLLCTRVSILLMYLYSPSRRATRLDSLEALPLAGAVVAEPATP